MATKSTPAYIAQWKLNLQQWQSSDLTISAWCQEHNIKQTAFYYWRNKLMPDPKSAQRNEDAFVELTDKPSCKSGISIKCYGVVLHLERDFHPDSLLACLNTLRKT